jgi:hypothetical protein
MDQLTDLQRELVNREILLRVQVASDLEDLYIIAKDLGKVYTNRSAEEIVPYLCRYYRLCHNGRFPGGTFKGKKQRDNA